MHAILTTTALPLFLGALLADWAYARSEQIQWTNFASWLIAGGLVLAGLALLWAAVDALRTSTNRHRRSVIYLLLLAATCGFGFVNALIHARDGWAAMPAGLVLSALVLLLLIAASITGLVSLHRRAA